MHKSRLIIGGSHLPGSRLVFPVLQACRNRRDATTGSFRINSGDGASQWRYGPFLPVLAMTNVLTMRHPPRTAFAQGDGAERAAWRTVVAQAALAARASRRGRRRRARHGLAKIPLGREPCREPRRVARLHRRQHGRSRTRLHRALCGDRGALFPGGAVLTLAGGLLFGWLLGGIASMIGATLGAVIVFLIAKSALSEVLAAKAGPWLDRFRRRLPARCVQLSALLATRADLSLLAGQSRSWTARRKFQPPISSPRYSGIIPGTFAYSLAGSGLDSVIAAQQSAHQSCLAKMGAGGQEFLPVYARSWGAFDAGADCWARCAWARCARAGSGQMVQAPGGLRGQG